MESVALGHHLSFVGVRIISRSEAVLDLGGNQAVQIALELADAVRTQHRVAVGDDPLLIAAEDRVGRRQTRRELREELPPSADHLVRREHHGAPQLVGEDELKDLEVGCWLHASILRLRTRGSKSGPTLEMSPGGEIMIDWESISSHEKHASGRAGSGCLRQRLF